jgi:bifunctional NMN adenylyltransferase/nudix hydrolase
MKNSLLENHSSQPDLCVFIGRFEPLHAGHVRVIQEGLDRALFMVVLVGSANEPRTFRNPFNVAERTKVIHETFGNNDRLIVLPLEDSAYNLNDWIDRTHQVVEAAWAQIKAQHPAAPDTPSISLIGHAKDASSFYLNLFPVWGSINVPQLHRMCATTIRKEVFGTKELIFPELEERERKKEKWPTEEYIDRYTELARENAQRFLATERALIGEEGANLTLPVLDFLDGFILTDDYRQVCAEYAFVARYHFSWRHAPYAPSFITADAIVVQSGYVLMVKRNNFPGKGLWALPGGFVETDEYIFEGALRELNEETAIKVPPAVLRGHMKAKEVFDAPHRSSRGRTATHAYLFHLDPGPLPKVKKGGMKEDDESQKIAWVRLSQLRRDQCFEDHYSIITKMTAGI